MEGNNPSNTVKVHVEAIKESLFLSKRQSSDFFTNSKYVNSLIQATYFFLNPKEELHVVYTGKHERLGSKLKHLLLIIPPRNQNTPLARYSTVPASFFPRLNLSWRRDTVNSQRHTGKPILGSLSSTRHVLQHNPRTSCSLKHTWKPLSLPQGMQPTPLVSH